MFTGVLSGTLLVPGKIVSVPNLDVSVPDLDHVFVGSRYVEDGDGHGAAGGVSKNGTDGDDNGTLGHV